MDLEPSGSGRSSVGSMVLGFGRGYPFPSKENDRLNIFGRPNGKFIEAKLGSVNKKKSKTKQKCKEKRKMKKHTKSNKENDCKKTQWHLFQNDEGREDP
jgi:hypothetical protein